MKHSPIELQVQKAQDIKDTVSQWVEDASKLVPQGKRVMTKKTTNETKSLYTMIAAIHASKILLNEAMDILRFGLLDDQDTTNPQILELERLWGEISGDLSTMSRLVHSLQGNKE